MPPINAAASPVRINAAETRDRRFMVELRDSGLRAERLDSSTWRLHGTEVAGERSNLLLLTGDGSAGTQLNLRAGMSADEVLKAVEARLQEGFSIERLPSPEGVIDFRIVETFNDPARLTANLADAASADSFGGEKLTYGELSFAYRQAKQDGLTEAEQAALAEGFEKFAQTGDVTAAARLFFGHLSRKFDL